MYRKKRNVLCIFLFVFQHRALICRFIWHTWRGHDIERLRLPVDIQHGHYYESAMIEQSQLPPPKKKIVIVVILDLRPWNSWLLDTMSWLQFWLLVFHKRSVFFYLTKYVEMISKRAFFRFAELFGRNVSCFYTHMWYGKVQKLTRSRFLLVVVEINILSNIFWRVVWSRSPWKSSELQ